MKRLNVLTVTGWQMNNEWITFHYSNLLWFCEKITSMPDLCVKIAIIAKEDLEKLWEIDNDPESTERGITWRA